MKLIENHSITKCQSGIIKVIINTVEKWADWQCVNGNDSILVFGEEIGRMLHESLTLELPFDAGVNYSQYEKQEKDQIVVIYVPFNLLK
jgi:hypothetical protein